MAIIGAPPQGLPSPGQYLYRPESHSLTLLRPGDIRRELAEASLHQEFIAQAPAVIAIGASPGTTTFRYGSRGHRYVLMEAGHAGQNISLMAVSLGLGSVLIGAFEDDRLSALLGLSPEEEILYLVPVGPSGSP
jgi:SagB-type dehydrogenase family enzyme